MYILNDGTEVSADQIKTAFAAGTAVIVHSNADGYSTSGLALDGKHVDTRGQCRSVWDEVWTRAPQDVSDALQAAYYKPARR